MGLEALSYAGLGGILGDEGSAAAAGVWNGPRCHGRRGGSPREVFRRAGFQTSGGFPGLQLDSCPEDTFDRSPADLARGVESLRIAGALRVTCSVLFDLPESHGRWTFHGERERLRSGDWVHRPSS